MKNAAFNLCAPQSLLPDDVLIEKAHKLADKYDPRLTITTSINDAVQDVDFIHTDMWDSMNEPKEVWDERIGLLKPYQLNTQMIETCDNLKVKFLHCLPSFQIPQTTLGKDIFQKTDLDGLEVTDDVFGSYRSVVFDQAENRMHTIKAVMVATLGD